MIASTQPSAMHAQERAGTPSQGAILLFVLLTVAFATLLAYSMQAAYLEKVRERTREDEGTRKEMRVQPELQQLDDRTFRAIFCAPGHLTDGQETAWKRSIEDWRSRHSGNLRGRVEVYSRGSRFVILTLENK